MSIRFGAYRRALIILVAVTAAIATAATIWFYLSTSKFDSGSMGDYGPQIQQDWAERLVTGLNTRDVNQVPVLRANGQLSDAQRSTVQSAMPAPGCHYELLAVDDRGEQGRRPIPGLSTENSAYRFDMNLNERCSGVTRTRVLGVMSIAEMGYWEPFYFTV
ncbi:hypothetical protein [Mycolicibacter heraklionensis]|uniref:hypothetical protein n=1 Tax=Mycolicibacter heraklionensis TaxID=512402 RepID=UPI000AA9BD7C|nr:hypothetical protein [Mycolicibacter heraklionensis]